MRCTNGKPSGFHSQERSIKFLPHSKFHCSEFINASQSLEPKDQSSLQTPPICAPFHALSFSIFSIAADSGKCSATLHFKQSSVSHLWQSAAAWPYRLCEALARQDSMHFGFGTASELKFGNPKRVLDVSGCSESRRSRQLLRLLSVGTVVEHGYSLKFM